MNSEKVTEMTAEVTAPAFDVKENHAKVQAVMAEIEKVVDDIERGLNNMMEKEVASDYIGELVMEKLKDIDEVAYVRFASVYRQFKDINTFMDELAKLLSEK